MENEDITIHFSPGSLSALNACLAVIMFGVALGIKPANFIQLRHDKKGLLTALFSQYVLLPIITIGLIILLEPSNDIALGMILVAACPGGNASNFFTVLAKGHVALSVTLTAITSLFCFLITPASFLFWSSFIPGLPQRLQTFEISFADLFINMITILLLPLVLGMTFAYYLPKATEKISKPLRTLSIVMLIGLIAVVLFRNLSVFQDHILSVFWIVLLHNGLALSMAYYFSYLMKNSENVSRTVAIETGIQNSGLALILIFTFFQGDGAMALVAAWWGIWHLITGFSFAYIVQRKTLPQTT